MSIWSEAVRRVNQTPLARRIEGFGERQIKPLLRGLDADNATTAEIEGLAWTPNNLRGVAVGLDRDKPISDAFDADGQYTDEATKRRTKALHKRKVPITPLNEEQKAKYKQAPVLNSEPNLLGRLLISDVNDAAATQLLNDQAFAKALGTEPSALLAARQQINDAATMGARIQQDQPRNPDPSAIQPVTEGQDISVLLSRARETPNNQNISNVLDAIRNPVITFFDETKKPSKKTKRSTLRNAPQPETYEDYLKHTIGSLDKGLTNLQGQGQGSTTAASNLDIPNRDLLTREQFELRKASGEPFDMGMVSEVFEPSPYASDPVNPTEQMFLADFLTRKLGVSPDVVDLANAASSPALREKALGAQQLANDNIAFAEAYGEDFSKFEEQAKALGQMRDAVIGAEELGLNATDIIKSDELQRSRKGLIKLQGRTKVPAGNTDPEVAKFIKNYAELEDLQVNSPQMEEAISKKIAELDATRPDAVEAGLKFIADQGTAGKGGGRKTAAYLLAQADRAGLQTPFLSKSGDDVYKFFINKNNPLNLGTPTLLAGSAALAGAGAMVVDSVNQQEIDKYDNSMAQQYAREVLRKADPAAVAYAIANSNLY